MYTCILYFIIVLFLYNMPISVLIVYIELERFSINEGSDRHHLERRSFPTLEEVCWGGRGGEGRGLVRDPECVLFSLICMYVSNANQVHSYIVMFGEGGGGRGGEEGQGRRGGTAGHSG